MRNLWQIFRIPLLLAVLNVVGLLAALLDDGVGDALSWIALAVVVGVALGYRSVRPRRHPGTYSR